MRARSAALVSVFTAESAVNELNLASSNVVPETEAAKPQALPFKQYMTVLDVMIAVGGLTDFADGNRAVLLRPTDTNGQYTVRLRDLVKRGDVSANVDVKPGDVLIIPQSWF